jgi:hypothetical protein
MIKQGKTKEIDPKLGDRDVESVFVGRQLVYEAGNFRTADGNMMRTRDGFTFNVKKN